MRMRRIPAALLALTVTVGLAACSDSKDEKAVSTSGDGKAVAASSTSSHAFCDGVFQFDATPLPTPGSPDFPKDAAAVKQLFAGVTASFQKIESAAPKAVKADATTLVTATQKAAETGEVPKLDSPEFTGALADLHAAVGRECGYQNVEVTGIDYAFQGVGATLKPGKTNFSFANATTHNEPHEMVVVRKKDGVTDSFDQLLQMPEDQAMSKIDMVTVTFAGPGGKSGVTADLKKGEYLMLCFIPVGGGTDGPPHFTRGMRHEFTVS